MFILKAYFAVFSMALLCLFSSCEKGEIDNINVADSDIHGEWKLVTTTFLDENDVKPTQIDYLQYNITYNFNTNNVLEVSGPTNVIEDYRGHERGRYTYNRIRFPKGPANPEPENTLGNQTFIYDIIIGKENHGISFGWVFYDYYRGPAMHLNTSKGILVLIRADKLKASLSQ